MSDEIVVTRKRPQPRRSGMPTFDPQVSVKLIKAVKRTDLVEGMPAAAERYGSLDAIDLSDWLGDNCGVSVTKSVRECGGGFHITLVDKKHASLETLYALIEPMDLVEIRFCRSLADYGKEPPVVMRGFVTDVTRNEVMTAGGRPQRQVVVAGHDFGKILQIIQIFYLNNSVVGDNILDPLAFFHKYGDVGDAKSKPANEFLQDVVDKVVNPYLKDLTALANGESIGAKVANELTVEASIEGTVSPYTVASFNNVALADMLSQLLDVGPFNELFVEDTEEGVRLVLRPNPFLDAKGQPIQDVEPLVVEASEEEVVNIGLTRTDAGVANYYWVVDSRWTLMSNEDAQRAAQIGQEKDYVLFEYLNAKSSLYGVRKMEVQTLLGDPAYSNTDALAAAAVEENTNRIGSWLEKRRKVLADSNKDNVIFENGTITLRGNEKIKAGMQLKLRRGGDTVSSFYIVRVDHDFRPFDGFTTRLTVERGTNFIERAQAEQPLYFPEMQAGGIR